MLKSLVALGVVATLAAVAGATRATLWAWAYRNRTGEGFVFTWVMVAWLGVGCLGVVTGVGVMWWRARSAPARRDVEHR